MSRLDQLPATTTVTYYGNNVRTQLERNPEFHRTVIDLCMGLVDAFVKVYIVPDEAWTVDIAYPGGRRTMELKQRIPGGAITITSTL